ncbi:hypothetical protein K525DRAFT_265943 [Schizophyllum commune Loenen D]|nr:hypothetical protein K525DRAFT_265943 [Schizophyllum commune Loenen D]
MAKLALPSSQRLDFSDVGPWLDSSAPLARERYVPNLPDEHWESDLDGHDAIAPRAGDLRAALASVERDLEAMRSTREQIASLLRGVDALVDGMEETAARCRSRLAPVHKLPPDLLALIFRWSIAGWHIYLTYGALPGALTQVCRRWRMVAHSEPRLWTHIDVTENLPKWGLRSYFSAGSPEILASYLRYSQTLPLSVICVGIGNEGDKASRAVFHLLSLERHRIFELEAEVSNGDTSWFTLARKQELTGFPMLHHLDLSGWFYDDLEDLETIFPSPALRSLVLPTAPQVTTGKFAQALRHITTYTGPVVVDDLNIFLAMGDLEDCTIDRFDEADHRRLSRGQGSTAPRARLDKLRTLRLQHHDSEILDICGYIYAPQLQTLDISYTVSHSHWLQRLVMGFECQMALTSLSISVFADCVDVHNMLQACPEVQVLELRLECIWLDGDDYMPSQERMEREACIFERLESATIDTEVLARLRILKIVCEYPEHVVQDLALLRLVQRWATMQPPRLTDVEFWMTYEDHWEHKPPTADDVSRLRSLMDATFASVPRTTRVSFFSEYSDAAEDTIISEVRRRSSAMRAMHL